MVGDTYKLGALSVGFHSSAWMHKEQDHRAADGDILFVHQVGTVHFMNHLPTLCCGVTKSFPNTNEAHRDVRRQIHSLVLWTDRLLVFWIAQYVGWRKKEPLSTVGQ